MSSSDASIHKKIIIAGAVISVVLNLLLTAYNEVRSDSPTPLDTPANVQLQQPQERIELSATPLENPSIGFFEKHLCMGYVRSTGCSDDLDSRPKSAG